MEYRNITHRRKQGKEVEEEQLTNNKRRRWPHVQGKESSEHLPTARLALLDNKEEKIRLSPLAERQTVNPKVAGSNLAPRRAFYARSLYMGFSQSALCLLYVNCPFLLVCPVYGAVCSTSVRL